MKISGIYQIQSLIKPERIYIGSAMDINHRWKTHLNLLKKGEHHSIKLQNHFNKYGKNDLVFTIIELCFSEYLIIIEQHYIDIYNPNFNICKRAESRKGVKASEETKQKQRDARKGKPPWNKGKKGIQIAWNKGTKGLMTGMKGKHHSKESNDKNRMAHINRKASEKAKINMRKPYKEGRNGWNKGKHVSDEVKNKMRIARLKYLADKKIA
jgi:group I intron endonuclease